MTLSPEAKFWAIHKFLEPSNLCWVLIIKKKKKTRVCWAPLFSLFPLFPAWFFVCLFFVVFCLFLNFLSFYYGALTSFPWFPQTVGYMQINTWNSKFSSALYKKTGRNMEGPWEEKQKQFSLTSSAIPVSSCDSLAHLVNPKTWLLCSESREWVAASSTVSSLIWTVWLLHPAKCSSSPGFSLWGWEYSQIQSSRSLFSRHLAKLQFVSCLGVQFEDGLVFFPCLWAGKATALFSRHTKAIVWGMQTRAVQGMLDFDYVCSRDEPSVAAMVYPFT